MLLNKEGGTRGLLVRLYVIDYYSSQRIESVVTSNWVFIYFILS